MNDTGTWIAIISVVIALMSAWYAARSAKIAKKSLELALQQERRQNPNLKLYLFDGHVVKFRSQHFRIYAFHIRISNDSDADNSLADLFLMVEFSRSENLRSNLIVSHDYNLITYLNTRKYAPLHIPSIIAAHETITGYALFRIQDELLSSSSVEAYLLKALDSHRVESIIEPILIIEIPNEESMEKSKKTSE
jgi:hypothetical protein